MNNHKPKASGRLVPGLKNFGCGYRCKLFAALISAIAVIWLMFWIASEVFEGETVAFDEPIRQWLHSFATPFLTSLFTFISFLGLPAFLVGLGVIVVGLFLYYGWKRAAVLFLITMAGEVILDMILKNSYARVRPDPFFDYLVPGSFSFPSGHALGSFCFYGILAWLVTSRITSRLSKWSIRSAAAALIFLIGVSRVYLGVHYPTDVLAGCAVGLIWTLSVAIGNSYFARPAAEKV